MPITKEEYWPSRIEHRLDEPLLHFVESSIYLVSLGPRFTDYDVFENSIFDRDRAKALADAAEGHWQAILDQDIVALWTNHARGIRSADCHDSKRNE